MDRSFVIAVILLLKVIPPQVPHIATVDVTGIVRQFVRSQAKLNLPPKALEQRVNRFGHQLEATLNRIAQDRISYCYLKKRSLRVYRI